MKLFPTLPKPKKIIRPADFDVVAHWKKAGRILLTSFLFVVVGSIIFYAINNHYKLFVNKSESLPGKLYLIKLGETPVCSTDNAKPNYLAFHGYDEFYEGHRLIKIALGCAGDIVKVVKQNENNVVYVNSYDAGTVTESTPRGDKLLPITPSVIPEGFYYAHSVHPESFDSRYRRMSLVPQQKVIGRAWEIF